jgi:acetyl esterase/lipase
MGEGMPSQQFEMLLQTFGQSESDPDASLEESIAAYRRYCADCATVKGVSPVLAASTRVTPVVAHAVPSEWVLADGADPNLRLLFIHGGSFIAGSSAEYRQMTEALSRETGAAVLAPDYRLAPESPFPAGLDDCVAAWNWMLNHGPVGAAKSKANLLSGGSAGGGLALALMLRLRDEDKILPDAAAVFSPAADFTASSPSMTERAHLDPTIKKEDYAWVAGLYVADGTALTNPYVSPVFGDFSGLPPLMVFVGEREVMHDEAKSVADKARQAGIEAHFKPQPGMLHNIQYWCHYVPEGLASLKEAGAFLKSHI